VSQSSRREWLETTALLGSMPCACLAKASNDCCTVQEIPREAVRIEPDLVTIQLDRAPLLHRTGSAAKIIEPARNLQIIVARPRKDLFIAVDQKCTHGGGALTYVDRRKHLYCTCWGHALFALDGTVLRWPNKQPPRPLRAHTVRRIRNLLEIRVEGLA
jgi:nitrite reductase/ring-hydroxylating ferredoxin subunit